MTDLEIPYEQDRKGHYRFFEILPGALSWLLLFSPIYLSFIDISIDSKPVPVSVPFILIYLLIYFVRTSIAGPIRTLAGYRTMKNHMRLNWEALLEDLNAGEVTATPAERPKWHYQALERVKTYPKIYKPGQLTHAVIIAT